MKNEKKDFFILGIKNCYVAAMQSKRQLYTSSDSCPNEDDNDLIDRLLVASFKKVDLTHVSPFIRCNAMDNIDSIGADRADQAIEDTSDDKISCSLFEALRIGDSAINLDDLDEESEDYFDQDITSPLELSIMLKNQKLQQMTDRQILYLLISKICKICIGRKAGNSVSYIENYPRLCHQWNLFRNLALDMLPNLALDSSISKQIHQSQIENNLFNKLANLSVSSDDINQLLSVDIGYCFKSSDREITLFWQCYHYQYHLIHRCYQQLIDLDMDSEKLLSSNYLDSEYQIYQHLLLQKNVYLYRDGYQDGYRDLDQIN